MSPLIPMWSRTRVAASARSTSIRACSTTASSSWARPSTSEIANLIVAQMVHLESDDPEKDISLYINSPGGDVYAGMAIYDTMQFVQPDVATICFGMAMSMGAILLAGGAAGKRSSLPNAKIMIHQGSTPGFEGQATDIEIRAREILALQQRMEEILSHHTGQPVERIHADVERDNFMSAAGGRGLRPDRQHHPEPGGRPRAPRRHRAGSGARGHGEPGTLTRAATPSARGRGRPRTRSHARAHRPRSQGGAGSSRRTRSSRPSRGGAPRTASVTPRRPLSTMPYSRPAWRVRDSAVLEAPPTS